MKIIIVGLGQTGTLLAEYISKENHDVYVIDNDKDIVEKVTDRYNVSGTCGSGTTKNVLMMAGADTADIVIATTPVDEINMMVCMVAKSCGTRKAVARIRRPELSGDRDYFSKEFGIDYIVNPTRDTAIEIARHIGLPGKVRADGFFSSKATIIKVVITDKSSLDGMALKDVRNYFGTDMLVVTIIREGKLIVPKGDFVIKSGDIAGLLAPDDTMSSILMKLNLLRKPVKRVFIIGGGEVAYYLATQLIEENKQVTILECNRKRCMELSELLPKAEIAYVDNIDSEVLMEEGIKDADVCVSLTGSDETNLVISMFAWSCNVESVITKVKSISYEKLLNKVDIDITISPAVILAERIVRYVRNETVFNAKGKDIKSMFQIADGMAEAIEFVAYNDCIKKGILFKSPEFKLKKDIIIAVLIREGRVIVPDGQSTILPGDHVVVISKKNAGLNVLNDIFAG